MTQSKSTKAKKKAIEEKTKKAKVPTGESNKVELQDVFDCIDDWWKNHRSPRVKDVYPVLIVELKNKIKDECS